MGSSRQTPRERGQVSQLCPEYIQSRLFECAACSGERGKISRSARGAMLVHRSRGVALAKDIQKDFFEMKSGMHRGDERLS